jgi:hypothetical protein
MTFFPVEKPCDKCGTGFLASTPGQTTCTQCLIHPRKKIADVPEQTIIPKGNDMHNVLPEKTCIACGKPYKPTSNVQKRCFPCIEIHKSEDKKKRNEERKIALKAATSDKKSASKTTCDDAMVLRMLVAAGLVTEEKINQAREIVRKLAA